MALFENPDYDNHEQVCFIHDSITGLKAIIAVHNTNLGASIGGCRMYPYANSADALTDVLRLSKGMTYKAAMANLPQGGGKSVIIGNPRSQKSEALMQAMGRFVNQMGGNYIVAEDSGITVADVHQMASQTQFATGNKAQYSVDGNVPDGNPAPATSLGVFCGIKAAIAQVFNSDLRGKKVAIQGVGAVGLRLARHLHEAGADLFVSDIYEENLVIAERELGAEIVDNSLIHRLDVDVFSPCALGGAINKHSVNEIKANIVAGAANNQLATNDMDKALYDKGIVYVPDYVINAGGIIDIYHQSQCNSSAQNLRAQIEQIGTTVANLLNRSNAEKMPTQCLANTIAEEKFKKL